jgi:hypothetical protein
MKRTPLWALVAFFPFIALALAASVQEPALIPATAGYLETMVWKWWFVPIVVGWLAHTGYFTVHMLRNAELRWCGRALWIGTLWMLGPLLAPIYWWLHARAA